MSKLVEPHGGNGLKALLAPQVEWRGRVFTELQYGLDPVLHDQIMVDVGVTSRLEFLQVGQSIPIRGVVGFTGAQRGTVGQIRAASQCR